MFRRYPCALAFQHKKEEGRRTGFIGKIRMKKAKSEVLTLREVFREFVNPQKANPYAVLLRVVDQGLPIQGGLYYLIHGE